MLDPDSPMPWVHKGLANNHKICNPSNWTRYGTDKFLGSEMDQGPCFDALGLKHNRLEPDGWLMRIRKYWPWTYKSEIAGAKRVKKTRPSWGRYKVDGFVKSLEFIVESKAAAIIPCVWKPTYEAGLFTNPSTVKKKWFFLLRGCFFSWQAL